jgi:hypothetical protein
MNYTPVLKLTLVDRCQLYVEYQTPLEGLSAYLLPLDTKIGNHEGSFQPGGHGFSFSARNIVLEQNILCAELKTSGGDWWYQSCYQSISQLSVHLCGSNCQSGGSELT